MAKERTDTEIQEQIKWLEANKKKVPHYNFFSEDNWRKIDIELEVLRDNLDEEECQQKVDDGDWTDADFEASRSILDWRDEGDDDAQPEKNWGNLIKAPEAEEPSPVKKADPDILPKADAAIQKAKTKAKPPIKKGKK